LNCAFFDLLVFVFLLFCIIFTLTRMKLNERYVPQKLTAQLISVVAQSFKVDHILFS